MAAEVEEEEGLGHDLGLGPGQTTAGAHGPSLGTGPGPSLVTGPDQSRVTVPGPEATTTRGTSPGQSPDHDQSLGQDPGTKKRRRRKRESE